MPSYRPKISYQMFKRKGNGVGVKGVLNNVEHTARLVKRDIPYYLFMPIQNLSTLKVRYPKLFSLPLSEIYDFTKISLDAVF